MALKRLITEFVNGQDYELELRLGTYNSNGSFNASVTVDQYNAMFNKLNGNTNGVREVTIVMMSETDNVRTHILYDIATQTKTRMYSDKKTRIDNIDISVGENENPEGVRISLSVERPVTESGGRKSIFRFKNRTSVTMGVWRYDFTKTSMFRSDNTTDIAEWRKRMFKQIEVDDNTTITDDVTYEIEVEYIGGVSDNIENSIIDTIISIYPNASHKLYNDTVFTTLKNVLVSKNKNIRRSEQFKHLLSKPVSLQARDTLKFSQQQYAVTAKADGERAVLCSVDGQFYIVQSKRVTAISCKCDNNGGIIMIDAEYIKESNTLLLFDMLINNGVNITDSNLPNRRDALSNFVDLYSNCFDYKIALKPFEWLSETGTIDEFYALCKKMYINTKYDYELDGLVFTPVNEGYYNSTIYKWKPPHQNSIDFLLKSSDAITYTLYVGASRSYIQKNGIRFDDDYFKLFPNVNKDSIYMPIPFTVKGVVATYATTTTNVDVPTETTVVKKKKVIKGGKRVSKGSTKNTVNVSSVSETSSEVSNMNDKIYEMTYSNNKWHIMREREDKTIEYSNGIGLGCNDVSVAYSIWELIERPVTVEQIIGDVPIDTGYFKAESTDHIMPMKKFHNFIKDSLYKHYAMGVEWSLELGGGRFNDIYRWGTNKISNVVVVDIDNNAILIGREREQEYKQLQTKIYTVVSDITDNTLTRKIRNAVYPKKSESSEDVQFDTVFAQFSLHYTLSSPSAIDTLYESVNKMLRQGGYFIITCFNGQRVHDLLKQNGGGITLNKNGIDTFTIKQLYTSDTLNSTGQKISVYVESLGGEYDEYLVNFDYLISVFKGFDVEIHTPFADYLKSAIKSKNGTMISKMSEAETTFSLLNDVLVLRKK
jgi:SAM-dependent methyltransferase